MVIACIADECHNCSESDEAVAYASYKSVVGGLRRRRGVRLLGLTATPCRMDHGRFDVKSFLKEFRRPSSGDARSFMSLQTAIERGYLAPYDVVSILRPRERLAIEELLQSDQAVVSMGDYHLVVLREVWRILMRDPLALLDGIMRGLSSVTRALVFLPPVGEEADAFVKRLGKRIRAESGPESFFDFRDRAESDQSASEMFERFRDAPATPGKPAVLVTVNRFSEGVSIDDIDGLVMLRATLSPRVAVQALGRGLRLNPENPNKRCRVLDAVCFSERLQSWEAQVKGK